jgi:SAM-dependent methyltransferase
MMRCVVQSEELCRVGGLDLTQEALDFCGFAPGSLIADIGCGKGATVRYLRAAGFDASGVDCDAAVIEQAGPYCRLADSSRLPYKAESLDGLFFECSLSQMDARSSILTEAKRVLKSDGRLIISDLYFRREGRGGFLPNRAGWQKLAAEAGFIVLTFEDKSDGLAEYAAQLLWHYGREELEKLCGCGMGELRAGNCGYFLMIARKGEE